MTNALAIKSNNMAKGIAISVFTFVFMAAIGFATTKSAMSMDMLANCSPTTLVGSGLLLVVCLSLPMLSAGIKGCVKTTLTLGSLASLVLGALLCIAA